MMLYAPMNDWRVFVKETQVLLSQKSYFQAEIKIQEGLYSYPYQASLLSVASAVYRAAGSREKSLECAQALISHHPGSWKGYGLAAQDLIALQRLEEAKLLTQQGVEKFPQQANILTIANDIYRTLGDRNKSLEYALGLIFHHPDNWKGYARATQDLIALKRFDEARNKIQDGLDRFPGQANILDVAYDAYRVSGDRNKSLDCALELIFHHPDNWKGYARASRDLIALKRFDEARNKIQDGLDRFPGQANILIVANDVYRAIGDHNKSLDFALGLIYHHPGNWMGYARATQDLIALKRFDEARNKIQDGLDRFPGQANILIVANDVYRAIGDHNKSLDFALGLIYHHPGNWMGYARATQDLIALKRFDEARVKVKVGLSRFPGIGSMQVLAAQLH